MPTRERVALVSFGVSDGETYSSAVEQAGSEME